MAYGFKNTLKKDANESLERRVVATSGAILQSDELMYTNNQKLNLYN
jgi:hypothetical protein